MKQYAMTQLVDDVRSLPLLRMTVIVDDQALRPMTKRDRGELTLPPWAL